MNLLLLDDDDFATATRVSFGGRRAHHVRRILRAAPGDTLSVGRIGGEIGTGTILSLDTDRCILEVRLDTPAPTPLPATLVLALPRPPVLGRVLAATTSFGVKRIVLLHTRRVEKTYWQARALEPAALEEKLRLGLEQARDTLLPEIVIRRRFRAFVEDELPHWLEGKHGVFAHPAASPDPIAGLETPAVVLVGPEGGLLDTEVDPLCQAGMRPISLGPRALRVETAVAALLGRVPSPG
jgi:RsmE family RNA methyltransferase